MAGVTIALKGLSGIGWSLYMMSITYSPVNQRYHRNLALGGLFCLIIVSDVQGRTDSFLKAQPLISKRARTRLISS